MYARTNSSLTLRLIQILEYYTFILFGSWVLVTRSYTSKVYTFLFFWGVLQTRVIVPVYRTYFPIPYTYPQRFLLKFANR